jgi:hypothetical protein
VSAIVRFSLRRAIRVRGRPNRIAVIVVIADNAPCDRFQPEPSRIIRAKMQLHVCEQAEDLTREVIRGCDPQDFTLDRVELAYDTLDPRPRECGDEVSRPP